MLAAGDAACFINIDTTPDQADTRTREGCPPCFGGSAATGIPAYGAIAINTLQGA